MTSTPRIHPANPLSRRHFLARTVVASLASGLIQNHSQAAETASTKTEKRIGFVDDTLENYHANVFLQALRGPLQARGFTLAGCTGLKEEADRVWATKNNVPYFADVAALNQAVDFFMVLAPSTPRTHAELCGRVFPFKKPTYVDKTFAPDLATAKELFALADRSGTAMQTSSALRYTNVQAEVKKLGGDPVEHMITWGGGGSFDEYAIHPLELLISVMGPAVQSVMRRGTVDRSQLLINFSGERTGVVNVYPKSETKFAASVTTKKVTRYFEVDASKIFEGNLAAVLDFFQAGKPNVDRHESLAIMAVLDACRKPEAQQRFVEIAL